jgi:hypothetical protein
LPPFGPQIARRYEKFEQGASQFASLPGLAIGKSFGEEAIQLAGAGICLNLFVPDTCNEIDKRRPESNAILG